MWVVQEYPDSYRVMATHRNGQPVAEPTEVARFPLTPVGYEEATAYVRELAAKLEEINDVLNA